MIPFSKFVPRQRGEIVSDPKKIPEGGMNLKKIYSLQITLSAWELFDYRHPENTIINPKFTEGPFHLEFKDIKAYKNAKDQ
jgi:hypothetical protein